MVNGLLLARDLAGFLIYLYPLHTARIILKTNKPARVSVNG
jgi:hypothetical protein